MFLIVYRKHRISLIKRRINNMAFGDFDRGRRGQPGRIGGGGDLGITGGSGISTGAGGGEGFFGRHLGSAGGLFTGVGGGATSKLFPSGLGGGFFGGASDVGSWENILADPFDLSGGRAGAQMEREIQAAKEIAQMQQAGVTRGIESQERLFERALEIEAPFRESRLRGLAGMELLGTGQYRGISDIAGHRAGLEEQLKELRAGKEKGLPKVGGFGRGISSRLAEKERRAAEIEDLEREIESFRGLEGLKAEGLSPLEQIQQQEGERAIQRAQAARGQFFSGAGLEQLGRFNERLLAESGQRKFGRLQTLAGLSPAGGGGQYAQSLGQNLANLQLTGAQAGAQALQAASQARAGFAAGQENKLMGLAGLVGSFFGG
jgi:hypothetical protein